MMYFNVRSYSEYKIVTCDHGQIHTDLGMLDSNECVDLAINLIDAATDLLSSEHNDQIEILMKVRESLQ